MACDRLSIEENELKANKRHFKINETYDPNDPNDLNQINQLNEQNQHEGAT